MSIKEKFEFARIIRNNLYEEVQDYIDKFNIDINNFKYSTSLNALDLALTNKSFEVAKILIKNGAKINVFLPDYSLLAKYAILNRFDAVDFLIENGADLPLKDRFDHDAFQYFSTTLKTHVKNKYPEIYKEYLMKQTADNFNI